jgi:hypothetical protein
MDFPHQIKREGYKMKHNKIFRTLVFIVILSLLLLALPVAPVAAQVVLLTPASGLAGSSVTVNGYVFTLYAAQPVHIFFDYVWASWATVAIDGTFTASFIVPASTAAGIHYVTVQHTSADYNPLYQIGVPVLYTSTAPEPVQERVITVSPLSGNIGSTVTIGGSDFNSSSSVTIYFDSTAAQTVTTTATGTFSGATFTVPESYGGIHTIKGSDASGDSPAVNFTTLQTTTVTPTSGTVSDTISISGTGFAANSIISTYFDNSLISAGVTTTNASGSFTNNLSIVPSSSRGNHTIRVQDASSNLTTTTFETREKMAFTPIEGTSGTVVTVSGTGFKGSTTITIKYAGVPVTTNPAIVGTDVNGSFTLSFSVPAGATGPHSVEVTDGTYSASSSFTSMASAAISQITSETAPGHAGMEITLTGTGFKPATTVVITYTSGPVVLATATTDAAGTFSATVTIPHSIGGNHVITTTDGTTIKLFAFVMESQAPPKPVPLLPEDGVNVEAVTFFDWNDVDDLSGVTYTFQIARDTDFRSLVLEKHNLTTSEYTLNELEMLPSTGKTDYYCWRVKAVDGASNESVWSTSRSLYVSSFPDWAKYTLIVIGSMLLVLLAFWLGLRMGRKVKPAS